MNSLADGTQRSINMSLHLTKQVVRNHPDYQRPYTGITALKTGEVAYDAAAYLADSEQKSCAIAAGCFVTVSVVLCCSFMPQGFPGGGRNVSVSPTINRLPTYLRSFDTSSGCTPVYP